MKTAQTWVTLFSLALMAVSPWGGAVAADMQTFSSASTSGAQDFTPSRAASAGGPIAIAYSTDTPCPVKRLTHLPARHRVARVHHIVHRRRVRHPKAHVHKVALHHMPARCEILHRDRLYQQGPEVAGGAPTLVAEAIPAGAYQPELPIDYPIDGGSAVFAPGSPESGGGSIPGFANTPPGAGGKSSEPSPPKSPTSPGTPVIPGVPEPRTWALLILGVGLTGLSLRRRPARRTTVDG